MSATSKATVGAPRVWSLIVTVIGDLLMDEGRDLAPEPLPLPALTGLLHLFGIEPQLVRTNLSRLVADGTLARAKAGRNTFYTLSPASASAFADAAGRIYGRTLPAPTGRFEALALDRCAHRAALRATLTADGWRALGPALLLRPEHAGRLTAMPEGAVLLPAAESATLAAAARELWGMAGLAHDLADFAATAPAPEALALLDIRAALRTRLALVHRYRRLVLRDPVLPAWALPEGWPAGPARAGFGRALGTLNRRGVRGVNLLQNS
jgi:phenylacetic acid degradation operon negative regulatory protein